MDTNTPTLDKAIPLKSSDKFPRRKKMRQGSIDVIEDEDYSVDDIIDRLKKKSLESFEKISDSESVDFPDNLKGSYSSLDVSTNTMDLSLSSQGVNLLELRDLLDRRISDARFDVVENKIDRVITSLKGDSNEEERQLLKIMLARIRDLEDKLDKKTTKQSPLNLTLDPVIEKPVHPYSTYVVEKATQTPSKDHKCEGVYVLVSKKNNQKVRQVHRHTAYCLDNKMNTKGTFNYHVHDKPTQPLVRKVVRRVGYPEYIYEETHENTEPTWNRTVRKSVAFLPPIPAPYAKRRPRNFHH